MNYKYLHVEIIGNDLYVYASDQLFGASRLNLNDLGNNCDIGKVRDGKHVAIDLSNNPLWIDDENSHKVINKID